MTPTIPTDFNVDLSGKNAIVTGASKGIGQNIALRLAASGANLAILGRDQPGLLQTQAAVQQYGVDCLIVNADFVDAQQVEQACQTILNHQPDWDVLVNNAGYAQYMPLLDMPLAEWEKMQAINLRAVFLMSKHIAGQMIKRRQGKIIHISSVATCFGTPGGGAYAAAKAGVEQLMRTMATEWGPHNLQINAVSPTVVLTNMGKQLWDDSANADLRHKIEESIPLKRFATMEEVTNVVLFLASSAADFLNGVIIPVDDGARWTK